MTLPVILILGNWIINGGPSIRSSISVYYYSNMRNVFVGILFAVALFLSSYIGHKGIDNFLGKLGACFAVGMALCRCEPDKPAIDMHPFLSNMHLVFAGLFFLVLFIISFFLFTKSDKEPYERHILKKRRNRLYRTCGGIMVLSMAGIIVIDKFFPELKPYNPEFWLEFVALFAFGVSWLTKGIKYKHLIPVLHSMGKDNMNNA